ncbi:hypothetical protein CMV_009122 [Castanea mollissima]|uniref:Uncharacterized protein n=1 Tax=Castanea mollissima TaxID=60419 RepID=A0A8J4RNT0_9ROSI|nr:hypothetical protein CMV_009122 [Castanea mollissima]
MYVLIVKLKLLGISSVIQDYMRGIRHSCGGYSCGRLVNKKKLFEVLQLSDKMCLSRRKMKFTYSKDVFSQMDWLGNNWGFRINSIQVSSTKELMSIFINPPPQISEHRVTKEQIHLIGNFDNEDWNIRNGVCMEAVKNNHCFLAIIARDQHAK